EACAPHKNCHSDHSFSFFRILCRRVFFQLLDDLEHAVAAHDGIVKGKFQPRRVFQDDGAGDQPLDADTMLIETLKAALLLVGIAENADEDRRGLEVARHVHVVDRNQPALADVAFTADGFADGALQKFAHALESEGWHGSWGLASGIWRLGP